MRGVEVRIRHEDADPRDAVFLTEVPFTEGALDDVVRLVKAWGVDAGDGAYFEEGFGSFQVRSDAAWFEVVVTS